MNYLFIRCLVIVMRVSLLTFIVTLFQPRLFFSLASVFV